MFFEDDKGICFGNISISKDLKHISCSTAIYHNFNTIVVAKDVDKKRYIVSACEDNGNFNPIKSSCFYAYTLFQSDDNNKKFEKWLNDNGIKIEVIGI